MCLSVLVAFLLQQWIYEPSSILGYTYIACLVLTLLSAVLINSTATFAVVLIGELIFG